MKKLFAILLTLLMVLSLPVAVAAEETTTAFDDSETGVVETNADSVEVTTSAEETEEVIEDGPKTNFGFFPGTLSQTLPIMGMGMLGIFLVTLVIVLAVLILSKFGGKKEE